MNNKSGGPAFPVLKSIGSNGTSNGMSLRDYFAAFAMQSLIIQIYNSEYHSMENIAKWSYEFADAMLKEASKK